MRNLKTGTQKYTLRLTALLIGCVVLAHDSSARVAASQRPYDSDLTVRAAHARELLGKSYERSPANVVGGRGTDLGRFIFESTRERLPESAKLAAAGVTRAILEESRRYGLDPVFTMSVIAHESRFNPTIVGSHGEIGLMQIKPDTAAWIIAKSGLKVAVTRPMRKMLADPVFNIKVGTAYLAQLRKRFGSHGSYYLAAYNMGARKLIHTVRENGMPHAYATNVMKHYLEFYGEYRAAEATHSPTSF